MLRPTDIPYYPQLEERDCGATCLRMLVEAYGIEVSMDRLRELTSTTAQGTSFSGIKAGAEALGFETLAADLPFDDLLKPNVLPAILHWDRDHFVVAVAADYSGVSLFDPADGKRFLERDEFEAHRYGPGRSIAGLLVRPIDNPDDAKAPAVTPEVVAAHSPQKAAVKSASLAGVLFAAIAFLVALAVSLALLKRILFQAVDLQFREGLTQHIGVLILLVTAVALTNYLLRKQAIRYASKQGSAEIDTVITHLRAKAQDASRAIRPDTYLELLQDSDLLRVWRAYHLPSLIVGIILLLVGSVYLLKVDLYWGLASVLCVIALAILASATSTYGRRNARAAITAQTRQREALYEYAQVLPNVTSFGGSGALDKALHLENKSADTAFLNTAKEHSAQKQLLQMAVLLSFAAILAVGLYQLGYAGLQLGNLVFGLLASALVLLPITSINTQVARWQQLLSQRLRLSDLEGYQTPSATSSRSIESGLELAWTSQAGATQTVQIQKPQRIGLYGTDLQARAALIAALLGRDNELDASLSLAGNAQRIALGDLGTYSLLTAHSVLASGSLLTNILLHEKLDDDRLTNAIKISGLDVSADFKELHNQVGFSGEGIDAETTIRVLIAQAIYHNVDVLILDSATQALSVYAAGILMDALLRWASDRILIINPQRVSAVFGCDLIIQLERGEIEAAGNHDALIAERGAYYYEVIAAQQALR